MDKLKIFLQIVVLSIFAVLGNVLMNMLNINFPGSIVGIVLVFLCLKTKIIKLEWIEGGANYLISNLMLFFVPSAICIVNYKQMVLTEGLRFELVIVLSTLTVMICTGVLAEVTNKLGKR